MADDNAERAERAEKKLSQVLRHITHDRVYSASTVLETTLAQVDRCLREDVEDAVRTATRESQERLEMANSEIAHLRGLISRYVAARGTHQAQVEELRLIRSLSALLAEGLEEGGSRG